MNYMGHIPGLVYTESVGYIAQQDQHQQPREPADHVGPTYYDSDNDENKMMTGDRDEGEIDEDEDDVYEPSLPQDSSAGRPITDLSQPNMVSPDPERASYSPYLSPQEVAMDQGEIVEGSGESLGKWFSNMPPSRSNLSQRVQTLQRVYPLLSHALNPCQANSRHQKNMWR